MDNRNIENIIKAAEQGNAEAQCKLGDMYYEGKEVEQDYIKSRYWYKKTAEQGNADAQNNLGFLYQHGLGVEQNYQEAIKWYEKAAEQGNASAQQKLVFLYLCGLGVQEDYDHVEKLSRKYYNNGCKELKYYVDIFDKFKKHKVKKIMSIAECIEKDIEEDIDAIFIKPEHNLYKYAHTLYDIETFKKIKKKAEKILEDIPIVKEDKSNELEVFSQICKKMANLITFDYSVLDNDEKLCSASNLIGALLEGKCVCAGYAELLRNLCLCRNIECIYVGSLTHAFNQVKIGGCWYYFDLTYCSNRIQRGDNIEDYLFSEEEFKAISEAKKPLKSQFTYKSPYNFKDIKTQQGATMKQLVNAFGHDVSLTDIEAAEKEIVRLNILPTK